MKYLKAIDASIDKWKAIVAGETFLERNCPLCNFFINCKYCPVVDYTKKFHCYGTPFYKTAHNINCRGEYVYPISYVKNNHMLSFLYELRLWYINQHTSRLAEFGGEGENK